MIEQGVFIKFCYNLKLTPTNLVQRHCIVFSKDTLSMKDEPDWIRGSEDML